MTEVAWTDRFAAPLDGVRRATLGAALRNRAVRGFFSSRDRRVAWILGVHACSALALTVLFPAPLLVLAPLVLGVPHVVADVRYLVLRRSTGRAARRSILAGSAALIAVNGLSLAGIRFDASQAEVALGTLLVFVAGSAALAGTRRASSPRKTALGALALAVIALVGWIATHRARTALVVLIHAHNWVAVIAWLWLFRARARSVVGPLALVAGIAMLLVSGCLVPLTLRMGLWRAFDTNLLAAADWLAPGVPGALGVGLASSFVYLQSVHYLAWLVLVPADERPGSGFVSFRRSFREFTGDLGTAGAIAALFAWALVLGFGSLAPLVTKNAYLALASFHVWLELAVLVCCSLGGQSGGFRAPVPS